MTEVYEIAPAGGGWALSCKGEILAECENGAWAVRVAKMMLAQGRRAGRPVQIWLASPDRGVRILGES